MEKNSRRIRKKNESWVIGIDFGTDSVRTIYYGCIHRRGNRFLTILIIRAGKQVYIAILPKTGSGNTHWITWKV